MNTIRQVLIAFAITSLSASAFALEEQVGRNAEKGDPARWDQPADTPRLQYENALKEAKAALAEALAECRAQRADRKACEADARAQYSRDAEMARSLLSRASQ